MPLVLLWLSLLSLCLAKVESIRFGGCWVPHCTSCPSKASICLECSHEYVFDKTSGNCIPANHHWSSEYSQDRKDGSFDDLKKPQPILYFLISVSGCLWMCCCIRNDEEDERSEIEYNLAQRSNNTIGDSDDARENSNLAENASRMHPPIIPSALRANNSLNQATPDHDLPLLSSGEYDSPTQPAALIVEPDGGYHLGIKN